MRKYILLAILVSWSLAIGGQPPSSGANPSLPSSLGPSSTHQRDSINASTEHRRNISLSRGDDDDRWVYITSHQFPNSLQRFHPLPSGAGHTRRNRNMDADSSGDKGGTTRSGVDSPLSSLSSFVSIPPSLLPLPMRPRKKGQHAQQGKQQNLSKAEGGFDEMEKEQAIDPTEIEAFVRRYSGKAYYHLWPAWMARGTPEVHIAIFVAQRLNQLHAELIVAERIRELDAADMLPYPEPSLSAQQHHQPVKDVDEEKALQTGPSAEPSSSKNQHKGGGTIDMPLDTNENAALADALTANNGQAALSRPLLLDQRQRGVFQGASTTALDPAVIATACTDSTGARPCVHGVCVGGLCQCSKTISQGHWRGTYCTDCDYGWWGSGCQNECQGGYCNPCGGNGVCSQGTNGNGKCECFSDAIRGFWTGTDCSACLGGYFGEFCLTTCPGDDNEDGLTCNGRGECLALNQGRCTCITGWGTDTGCADCDAAHYGENCATACEGAVNVSSTSASLSTTIVPCSGHGRCFSGINGNGSCVCDRFYSGRDCSTLCPNFCSGRGECSDGVTGTGTCTCAPSYAPPSCSVCMPNATGPVTNTTGLGLTTLPECTVSCPLGSNGKPCSGNGACFYNPTTQRAYCQCASGYTSGVPGSGAVENCAYACLGTPPCSGHGTCVATWNSAAFRQELACQCYSDNVKGFFTGTTCNACDLRYNNSASCLSLCPVSALGVVCSGRGTCSDGICFCNRGTAINPFDYCGTRCELDSFSPIVCAMNCEPFYFGTTCTQSCLGVDAGRTRACSGHGTCNEGKNGDGRCFCQDGYAGSSCNLVCPAGLDGVLCSGRDRGTCATLDGQTATCSCLPFFAGDACQVACPIVNGLACSGRGTCQSDGTCACTDRLWTGAACDVGCLCDTTHGQCDAVACRLNQPSELCQTCQCDTHFIGDCTACAPGRQGLQCEGICGPNGTTSGRECLCDPLFASASCTVACPIGDNGLVCSGRGTCLDGNRGDGSCQCTPTTTVQYYGHNCSIECSTDICFSQFKMQNGACNAHTGLCECQNDANGQWRDDPVAVAATGLRCSMCVEGYWGPSCVEPCNCNAHGTCDPYSGECSCFANTTAGFYAGSSCASCSPGYIGQQCDRINIFITRLQSERVLLFPERLSTTTTTTTTTSSTTSTSTSAGATSTTTDSWRTIMTIDSAANTLYTGGGSSTTAAANTIKIVNDTIYEAIESTSTRAAAAASSSSSSASLSSSLASRHRRLFASYFSCQNSSGFVFEDDIFQVFTDVYSVYYLVQPNPACGRFVVRVLEFLKANTSAPPFDHVAASSGNNASSASASSSIRTNGTIVRIVAAAFVAQSNSSTGFGALTVVTSITQREIRFNLGTYKPLPGATELLWFALAPLATTTVTTSSSTTSAPGSPPIITTTTDVVALPRQAAIFAYRELPRTFVVRGATIMRYQRNGAFHNLILCLGGASQVTVDSSSSVSTPLYHADIIALTTIGADAIVIKNAFGSAADGSIRPLLSCWPTHGPVLATTVCETPAACSCASCTTITHIAATGQQLFVILSRSTDHHTNIFGALIGLVQSVPLGSYTFLAEVNGQCVPSILDTPDFILDLVTRTHQAVRCEDSCLTNAVFFAAVVDLNQETVAAATSLLVDELSEVAFVALYSGLATASNLIKLSLSQADLAVFGTKSLRYVQLPTTSAATSDSTTSTGTTTTASSVAVGPELMTNMALDTTRRLFYGTFANVTQFRVAVFLAYDIVTITPSIADSRGNTTIHLWGNGFGVLATPGGLHRPYCFLGGETPVVAEVVNRSLIRCVTAAVNETSITDMCTGSAAEASLFGASADFVTVNMNALRRAPPPVLDGITPRRGSAATATRVTVQGSGFVSSPTCKFYSSDASNPEVATSLAHISVSDPNLIECFQPPMQSPSRGNGLFAISLDGQRYSDPLAYEVVGEARSVAVGITGVNSTLRSSFALVASVVDGESHELSYLDISREYYVFTNISREEACDPLNDVFSWRSEGDGFPFPPCRAPKLNNISNPFASSVPDDVHLGLYENATLYLPDYQRLVFANTSASGQIVFKELFMLEPEVGTYRVSVMGREPYSFLQAVARIRVTHGTPKALVIFNRKTFISNPLLIPKEGPIKPDVVVIIVDDNGNTISDEATVRQFTITASVLLKDDETGVESVDRSAVIPDPSGLVYSKIQLSYKHGVSHYVRFTSVPVLREGITPPIRTVSCAANTFKQLRTGACLACPSDGAICDGSEIIYVKPGYWRAPSSRSAIYACPSGASVCLGNSLSSNGSFCSEEYRGDSPLCSVCAEGYAKSGSNTCAKCISTTYAGIVVAAVVAVVLVGVVIWVIVTLRKAETTDISVVARTFVNHVQATGELSEFTVRFDPIVRSIFAIQSTGSSLSINGFQVAGCVLAAADTDYEGIFWVYMGLPILCGIIAGVVFLVVRLLKFVPVITDKLRAEIDADILTVGPKAKTAILLEKYPFFMVVVTTLCVTMFTLYQTLITQSTKVLQCTEFETGRTLNGDAIYQRYLTVDMSVECNARSQHSFSTAALTLAIGYGFGVPTAFIFGYHFVNSRISKPELTKLMFLFLMGGYKEEYWYWQGVIMVRKLIVVLTVVLIRDSKLQTYTGMIVMAIALCLQLRVAPSEKDEHNHVEALSLSIITATLSLSMVYFWDASDILKTIVTVTILIVTFGALIMFAIFAYKPLKEAIADAAKTVKETVQELTDMRRHRQTERRKAKVAAAVAATPYHADELVQDGFGANGSRAGTLGDHSHAYHSSRGKGGIAGSGGQSGHAGQLPGGGPHSDARAKHHPHKQNSYYLANQAKYAEALHYKNQEATQARRERRNRRRNGGQPQGGKRDRDTEMISILGQPVSRSHIDRAVNDRDADGTGAAAPGDGGRWSSRRSVLSDGGSSEGSSFDSLASSSSLYSSSTSHRSGSSSSSSSKHSPRRSDGRSRQRDGHSSSRRGRRDRDNTIVAERSRGKHHKDLELMVELDNNLEDRQREHENAQAAAWSTACGDLKQHRAMSMRRKFSVSRRDQGSPTRALAGGAMERAPKFATFQADDDDNEGEEMESFDNASGVSGATSKRGGGSRSGGKHNCDRRKKKGKRSGQSDAGDETSSLYSSTYAGGGDPHRRTHRQHHHHQQPSAYLREEEEEDAYIFDASTNRYELQMPSSSSSPSPDRSSKPSSSLNNKRNKNGNGTRAAGGSGSIHKTLGGNATTKAGGEVFASFGYNDQEEEDAAMNWAPPPPEDDDDDDDRDGDYYHNDRAPPPLRHPSLIQQETAKLQQQQQPKRRMTQTLSNAQRWQRLAAQHVPQYDDDEEAEDSYYYHPNDDADDDNGHDNGYRRGPRRRGRSSVVPPPPPPDDDGGDDDADRGGSAHQGQWGNDFYQYEDGL